MIIKKDYFLTGPDGCRFFIREFIPDKDVKAKILVAHGLSDHGNRFLFIADKLVNAGYHVFIPDLRGNGLSDGIRGHFDSARQMLDDITFFIEEIKNNGDGPVILYGQSMGGNIVLAYSLNYPQNIKAAISSSPWLRLAKPPAKALVNVSRILAKLLPKVRILNGLKSSDLTHDRKIAEAYDNDPLIHWKITFSTFFNITQQGENTIRDAEKLKIPVLLMHGSKDMITSYNASKEFSSKAGSKVTLLTWEDAYHELHNEPEKEEVLKKVVNWLEELK